ncbi:hypothetical protein [Aliikangiella coralliicola]|uniref:Cytochrome c domain-containing protein n=1 Tax=Aliikangiella coralliicola TaxID=2592383 RepID=A0A545UES8_9GAMM|nr:hypothetical protein [Aliikangiella coralliicola]TQV87977.1 hypothetical protein FLL46_09180 [Aliikangiella coralliicola]
MFNKIISSISITVLVFAMLSGHSHAQKKPQNPLVKPRDFSSFPDFGYMVSVADYEEMYSDHPVFKLKTNYPRKLPKRSSLPKALKIDFVKDWEKYMDSVKQYCFAGNIPEWNPHKNKQRNWYHIPWLHPSSPTFPPNGGTEGFHGLIKEAPVGSYQLHHTQTNNYQIYAITLINEYAGYTMGKMWKDKNNPDPGATDHRYGGGFPEGTIFCKLLFADVQPDDNSVPYLENPIQWQGYITESWNSPTRAVRYLRLLQMDIMVRDKRADKWMGWVLGTYAYNGKLNKRHCKDKEKDTKCRFKNLVPLGLQWGDDPDVTDNIINAYPYTKTKTNPKLKQTVINPSPDLPPQHLGWGMRLNGPADLNTSSCMSCHTASQFPAITPLVPPDATIANGFAPPPNGGNAAWMKYFINIPAATSSDPRAFSTDFSLQVAMSLQNFADAKTKNDEGYWAVEFGTGRKPVSRAQQD